MAMSRSFGAMRFTTLSPIETSPWLISSSPAIMRNSVDLPQPDGPTSTQNSPSAIDTSTPRMMWVEPNHFWTPAIFTAAMALLLAHYCELPRALGDSHGMIFISITDQGL